MDKIFKNLIALENGPYKKEISLLMQKMLSENYNDRPYLGEVISQLKNLRNPDRKRGFSLMNIYQSNFTE